MSAKLPPAFDDLREQLREAAARDNEIEARVRQRVRRGRRRQWLIVTLGALVTFGGVAVAERAMDRSGPDAPADIVPPDLTAAADDGIVTNSAAPDPANGPPWALRVFTNPAGLDCVTLGRLVGGKLGTYDQDGTFHKLPLRAPGQCEDVAHTGLMASIRTQSRTPQRTIVFGMARDRRPVEITLGGQTHTVTPGGLGTFVYVVAGEDDLKGARVATTVNGRRTARDLGR